MSSSSAGSFSPGSIASVSEAETCSGQTGREKRILLSSPYAIALGSLPLCGTVDLSVNLDAKHLVAWGHVHGDGIQGTGQDVPVATRATAYPHRSASQWQATDGGGVAQLGNANLVVNFVS